MVITITLIILAIVGGSLYYSGRSTAKTRAKVLKKQEIMKVFNQFRRQVISLYRRKEGPCMLGVKGLTVRESEIYFLTSVMNNHQGVGEVGYKILKDDKGRPGLYYTEFPYPREKERRFAYVNPQDKWRPISNVVRGLRLEYESQNQWFDEWKRDDPPDKVRVTLYYEGSQDRGDEEDDSPEIETFKFIIVPGLKTAI